jgi:hypothetical protein
VHSKAIDGVAGIGLACGCVGAAGDAGAGAAGAGGGTFAAVAGSDRVSAGAEGRALSVARAGGVDDGDAAPSRAGGAFAVASRVGAGGSVGGVAGGGSAAAAAGGSGLESAPAGVAAGAGDAVTLIGATSLLRRIAQYPPPIRASKITIAAIGTNTERLRA